ncbi:response regulator transcription factor [uncultured Kordia sp.]|uniref:LytR/AlgR family response regulator transcription factor n=1 Tax=uncultured Kordia sp. TaxID=507699 RepID=UPI00260756A1|nr:response regulator transcription factor [uncultured Kordia sp.]
MSKINVLILKDNSFEAKILKEFLEQNNYNIAKIARNTSEALEAYHSQTIDLMIVDLFLEGKPEGLDFTQTLVKEHPNFSTPFIFVTKHTDRIIFEEVKITSPHGFLVKPFNELELQYAIELTLKKHNADKEYSNLNSLPFFLKKHDTFYKVLPNDIFHAEVEGRYCKIHTQENEFLVQHSLTEFQKTLPTTFLRTHRNYIVNVTRVKEIDPKNNLIVLENDKTILLSRSFKTSFLESYKLLG